MSKTDGYSQLPSGYWTKLSDASSPYAFDGKNMIFLGSMFGNGSVSNEDIMKSLLVGFNYYEGPNSPKDGDSLILAISKLWGNIFADKEQLGLFAVGIKDLKSRVSALEGK